VLPYAILAIVGYIFFALPSVEDGAGLAVAFMVLVSAGCAILFNAVMLAWQRRRFVSVRSGGTA
jgi:divalent metal cation (Fe/Co/Zn/Cd) transporter